MKRIALFLLTNLGVLITLSVVSSVLGFNRYITAQGIDFGALLGFAAIFGFGGAFISLLISKWSAKMAVGAKVITEPATPQQRWLFETVQRHSAQAGIKMPEIAIYPSPEVNAFATGASRNNSLVAVSEGLLHRMTQDEAEAVIGHEISHVANGDMVTLTLIQGVLNTFVIFIARAVGSFIDRVVLKNEDGPGMAYFAIHLVLEIALGVIASMVVMSFSRHREFRADVGGSVLAGREKMIAALRRLQSIHEEQHMPEKLMAFGIAGGRGGFMKLMSSHPPLEARIAALEQMR
ncbi:MAG: protease htpX [Verrucomicrobiaceae bacterium]|nr:protease htpX [Verrucomicrobiaceae bacterium]